MKKIELTRGYFAIIDDEDVELVANYSWRVIPTRNTMYAKAYVRGSGRKNPQQVFMHRLIMDAPKELEVDHINGDGLDNRRENMRLCSHAQNLQNQRNDSSRGSSIYKGVSWSKKDKKWIAQICKEYSNEVLGYFKDEKEAALAYNEAALDFFGEFAKINEVE